MDDFRPKPAFRLEIGLIFEILLSSLLFKSNLPAIQISQLLLLAFASAFAFTSIFRTSDFFLRIFFNLDSFSSERSLVLEFSDFESMFDNVQFVPCTHQKIFSLTSSGMEHSLNLQKIISAMRTRFDV
ncbi:hypothetical protein QVD17_16490 [Tagetes erecta]|uniref:Uncharacterized protein n=1 Tax=Tagetes erecta TaxID=13708 RepID=A0AAD8KY01_TARER|nr:hypothetical protein QVD17_16490 [Tagetes erecta]